MSTKQLRVGQAYGAFFDYFQNFFPGLELVKSADDVKDFDLIIFSGGEDINPNLYGQENINSGYSDRRDGIELPILRTAMNLNKKILGVCRGLQLITAYTGGQLYQDIRAETGKGHPGRHLYYVEQDHPLLSILPKEINSMHHQGVKFNGSGLTTIISWNSIPELAVGKNIVGTQFHPEFMGLTPFFDWIKNWAAISEEEAKPKRIRRTPVMTYTGQTIPTPDLAEGTDTYRYISASQSLPDIRESFSEWLQSGRPDIQLHATVTPPQEGN